MMANARDVYNVDANKAGLADPQNRQFDLSFPYLSQSHVSVTVNGSATTAFTFATSTRIQLNTGPTAGDVVVLKRATSPNTRLVDYQTGSVLSDEILDKDSLQAFYLAQEANDVAEIVLSKNASNLYDAGNERITNVADPTGAQDVATKNYLENTWLSSSDKTQLNALNTTNLNTVAGSVSNVNTVAGAITNVNTVAGKSTEITALATTDNIQNMDDLAATGVIANIATVAGVAPTMSAAATNATNAAASASAAANSAAAAAASFDTFDDRYLGSKSSEPSVDNDGNALVSGALFFDSAVGSMKVYDGGNWILATSAGAASLLDYEFTATAGQTTFTGADNNSASLSYSAGNLIVTLNGIVLDNGSDYTATSGTSIVLASGAALNDHLAVVAFKSFTVADTVAASTGGTFAGGVTVSGTMTATAAQVNGNIAVTGTVDGRDVAADGTKLDTNIPSSLGTAGQILTVNAGATAGEWADAGGAFAASTVTITAHTTLTTAQNGNLIRVTATGEKVISLPAAATGLFYVFSNETAYPMYIKPNGTQTINGINASIILAAGADGIISCGTAGTNWSSVGITRSMLVHKATTIYNTLSNNGTRLTGTYTPSIGSAMLISVGSATAGSAGTTSTYGYTSGGGGGQSYAEKFIASPAASYAYEICAGGAGNPDSSFDKTTTVAGMTCTRGSDSPYNSWNNGNGLGRGGGTATGGTVNFTGGAGASRVSNSYPGGGGGAATRAGNGGNANNRYGGGTGGNHATSSAVGAAATARDSNTYAVPNSTSETYVAGIVGTNTGHSSIGYGAGPKTVVNFGSVNFTIADHEKLGDIAMNYQSGGGSRGANNGGYISKGQGGYVTFVEFI
jgi:hypothetical protein